MREHLTAWAYVPEFTGAQAALAIVGRSPTDDPHTVPEARPVLDLIRRAYEGTRRWFADAPEDGAAPPRGLLVSVEMQAAQGRTSAELAAAGAGDVRFLTWLRTPMADFDRQTFTRDVLARWVQEVGASTLYPFAGPQAGDQEEPAPTAEGGPRALKKAALIAELMKEWPTIESDLKDGARNGLDAARVPDRAGWYHVEKARQWADGRGKLQKAPGILAGSSPWASATRVTN